MAANVSVLGRLVRDPVKRDFGEGSSFAAFTFVTDSGAKGKDGKRKPLFLDVSAWGMQGENILQYCKKGSQLLIFGSIYDIGTFNNKAGEPVAKLSLTLDKFEFVSSYSKSNGNANGYGYRQNSNSDLDIPF